MLQPKKTKFRKQQKGRMKGPVSRGATIAFGAYGINRCDHGKAARCSPYKMREVSPLYRLIS